MSNTVKFVVIIFLGLNLSCSKDVVISEDWAHYLGDAAKSQYTISNEITKSNVSKLKVAWRYSSGDADPSNRSQIQCNPLVKNGIVYGTTARLKLFALNATTGEELWVFDPFDGAFTQYGMGVNRGLAWHSDQKNSRLFYTAGDQLFAIDPSSGEVYASFGTEGKVDLHVGLGESAKEMFINSNTPGIVYKDLLILGSRVSESTGAAPGHIRAFNVYTGDLEWIFHTIPRPGNVGYETWPEDAYQRIGGANVWAGFSLDVERGIVYCPTGSASYDFYGGDRHGDNLFANCILALDANTGERIWHYQIVHHDIWDKDLPIAPNLVTIRKNGSLIDAIVQPTKNGYLFILDRLTGEPIYEVKEISVPPSDLEGEKTSLTQPVPTTFPAFSRQSINTADLATRTAEAASYASHIFETTHHNGMFQPPTEEGSIVFPGFDGGGEWGGAAYDPVEKELFINSNELPWRAIMDKVVPSPKGESSYKSFCQSCHGDNFQGSELFGNVPSLKDLKLKLSLEEVTTIVQNGKGVMPGISWMPEETVSAIYDYINGDEDPNNKIVDESWPYPYRMRNYEKLYAPDGFPIIKPPWGQLTAIDLEKAEIIWQIPLGHYNDISKLGIHHSGTENYGGPVLTSERLLFIAATADEKIRAFNADTGEELWQHDLPAAGYATPAIYTVNQKQYVLIACGGGKLGTKSGDNYVAFALP